MINHSPQWFAAFAATETILMPNIPFGFHLLHFVYDLVASVAYFLLLDRSTLHEFIYVLGLFRLFIRKHVAQCVRGCTVYLKSKREIERKITMGKQYKYCHYCMMNSKWQLSVWEDWGQLFFVCSLFCKSIHDMLHSLQNIEKKKYGKMNKQFFYSIRQNTKATWMNKYIHEMATANKNRIYYNMYRRHCRWTWNYLASIPYIFQLTEMCMMLMHANVRSNCATVTSHTYSVKMHTNAKIDFALEAIIIYSNTNCGYWFANSRWNIYI